MVSPARLALRTAQLGMAYGVANQRGALSASDAERLLDAPVRVGISCVDTAPAYGASEARVGRFLRTRSVPLEIVTKLSPPPRGLSTAAQRAHVQRSIDASLAAIGQPSVHVVLLDADPSGRATGTTFGSVNITIRNNLIHGICPSGEGVVFSLGGTGSAHPDDGQAYEVAVEGNVVRDSPFKLAQFVGCQNCRGHRILTRPAPQAGDWGEDTVRPQEGKFNAPTTLAPRPRLSASLSGLRLRVALTDPEDRVGQVRAFALVAGEARRLPRLDTTAADRVEFGIDPALAPSVTTIRVEACAREDANRVLHTIELQPSLELPRAPAGPAPTAPPIEPAAAPSLPWWLVAGAVVTAALVGAAVYQELDGSTR